MTVCNQSLVIVQSFHKPIYAGAEFTEEQFCRLWRNTRNYIVITLTVQWWTSQCFHVARNSLTTFICHWKKNLEYVKQFQFCMNKKNFSLYVCVKVNRLLVASLLYWLDSNWKVSSCCDEKNNCCCYTATILYISLFSDENWSTP